MSEIELDLLEAKAVIYVDSITHDQVPADLKRCGTVGATTTYHAFKIDVNQPPFPLTERETAIVSELPFVIVHYFGDGDGEAYFTADAHEWFRTFDAYCHMVGPFKEQVRQPEAPQEGWTVLRLATPYDCVAFVEAAIRFADAHGLEVDRDESAECAIHMTLARGSKTRTVQLSDWYAKVAEVLGTPGATGIIGMSVGRSDDMYTVLDLVVEADEIEGNA